MRKNIPDVTVKTYENAQHTVCDFMPDRCLDDLFAFLSRKIPRDVIDFGG
jgi:hypothetical protein